MSEPSTRLSDQPQPPLSLLPFGVGAIIFVLLFTLGGRLGGELGSFMSASLTAVPFAILAILAYMGGERPNWAWLATGAWLVLMVGGTSVSALVLSFGALAHGPLNDPTHPPRLDTNGWLSLGLILLGILISAFIGVLLLLPAVRRMIARRLPIDAESFVHAIALVSIVSLGLICTMPLVVLGAPPLLAMVDQITKATVGRDQAGMLRDQLYGLIWTIPATIFAVGFGLRRNLREALGRLGLVRPSVRQVVIAVAIALLLAGDVQFLGVGISWLWQSLGWPVTDTAAFDQLLSFAINPIGAVVIGVVAGLGEELAVRGVLQPRLGLLLSNLFFVSLHALQYSWDALLVVFVVGVVCGIVRKYSNTTTAAIVHGTYNFTLIMLATAGIGQ